MSEVMDKIVRALKPFNALFKAFKDAGFQLYAVGGCVRDWVLDRNPKDIDFTTDAVPEKIKTILADNGYKVIPVGEVFGTIATVIDRKNYEITTFRVKESYTRGSRHPIVCYGNELALDLERRDLTINAMAATEAGEIIDPFGGLSDLQEGVLRVPRSSYARSLEIFGDDPLRILRLARFKSRLGFSVCEDATKAASEMAGSVLTVSHERWFAEIDGLLNAMNPVDGIQWLCESGIWQMLFPETVLMFDTHCEAGDLSGTTIEKSSQDLWMQTLHRVKCAPPDGNMRWAALLSLTGYAVSREGVWAEQVSCMLAMDILSRLKLSNARIQSILNLLTVLPPGLPNDRTARELAIVLNDSIESWLKFQEVRLETIKLSARDAENKRLESWKNALKPFIDVPGCAEIKLPAGLSAKLSETLGLRGKTLGLCLTHCREAVLDKYLSEQDPVETFVEWVRDHFETM